MLVQKPYMERRSFATFMKQWDTQKFVIFFCRSDHQHLLLIYHFLSGSVHVQVTSPQLTFEEYCSGEIPADQIINLMVGDLQRIRKYPSLGFQIEQPMSDEVWQAGLELANLGYDRHTLK